VNSERARGSSVSSRLTTSSLTALSAFMYSSENMLPSLAITATSTRLAPPKSVS
jgi:hypothetical protein